jgi:hypothetical protein
VPGGISECDWMPTVSLAYPLMPLRGTIPTLSCSLPIADRDAIWANELIMRLLAFMLSFVMIVHTPSHYDARKLVRDADAARAHATQHMDVRDIYSIMTQSS